MAAILRLRRGTSTPTLLESELFFNTTSETLVVGESTGSHTLVKLGSNTGDISFSGDITASNLSLSGNAVIDGNITLGGSIYLGDDSNDNIIISASLSGSLVPSNDGIYDLGADNKRYDNLYVMTASIENLNVGGSGILSSSQQITNYNTFLEINGMDVVSGSSQIDLTQTTNYISGIKTRLNSETVISGSSQVTISETNGYTSFSSSIATTDEGQNHRLDELESFSSSLDTLYEEVASGTHTLFSGSSQVQLDSINGFTSYSSSVDSRLRSEESISSNHESRVSNLESTGSNHESRVINLESTGSNHESRIDSLESFSSSLDDTFVTEVELNAATSSLSASLTETDVDFESRITEIETTFSSSVDSRLDSHESFSSSIDTTIKTKMNLDGVLSGSTQITNGSGILSSSNEDFNTFSSSIDSRVDSLETTFSSSVDSRLDSLEGNSHTHSNKTQLDTINQNLSNTSNVTFNDITASGNIIVSGDLTVLGTATEIQTSDLYIKDKLITVASGSTNSAEADGSGIEIDGAGKSIIWDDATQSFILNAQVSSSVGFKGDGSQLTGVTAADVEYFDVLNKPTLVSGSSQISFNGIIDKPTLFSGSSQVNADTIINFDSNVKDKMNLDNVISGSTQITDGSGLLSSSNENFTTFSSSIDGRVDLLETTFSSSVDSRLDEIETTFSSSVDSRLLAQEIFSESLDTKYLNTNGDSVVSGSSQIDVTQTTNIATIATTGSNVFIGNQTITGSLNISGSNIEIESPMTSSNTIEATFFYGDGSNLTNIIASEITYEDITNLPSGLVSQSSQIDVTQTQNYGSIRQYDDSDNTTHLNSLGVVSGSTYSSPSQGTLRATINGSDSDVDLGLQSTDTPIFNGIQLNSITQVSSGSEFTVLLQSSSNEIISSELGGAAFYHVSNSIDDGNPLVLGNAGAVKSYVDGKIIDASAGDITAVIPIVGGGLFGGGYVGDVSMSIDTGSQHFIDGVNGVVNLGDGIISSSDQVTQSLDTRYVNVSGDTVSGDLIISGDLTVNGTTTTISTTNLNVEDNIIELNYGGSVINGGILVRDTTGASIVSGSLLWDSVNDNWIAGKSGSESRILTTADNVITDSNLDSNVKDVLNTENVHSGSYLGTATTSQLTEGTNLYYTDLRVKTKLNSDNVISGSSQVQIDSVNGFTTFSSSVDTRIDNLESFSSSLDNTFVTETELNTATQSLQNLIDTKLNTSSYNTDSQSFDTRIDDLETFSSSLDNTFVTETELNTATQSLVNSIGTKLNTGSYNTDSQSFDSRIDSLEGVTSENPLTFNDTTTVDLIRTGDVITANVIGGVVSGSSQILDGSGILSSSNETFTAFSTSIDSRFDSLEGTTHTHSNKSNLDTINQNLSTTSDVQFNDIQVDGTGSFASDVTIYGDLNVFGTQSIINSTNLAIADNMIYLNSGSTVTNPDLGWAGNYNDGSYAHLGLFADASDSNTFKVYKGYTPEPEGEINTAHASFQLADFQSNINTSVTSSTQLLEITSESIVRGYVNADEFGTYIVSDGGIGLYTDNGTDGVVIAQNGDTTVYGSLTLQTIPLEATAVNAMVVGTGNKVSYRPLGSNAFTSTSIPTNNNELTNGAGYITGFDITTQTDSKYLRSDTNDTASGIITFSNTTQSTSNTTGAVIVSGGVGIAKTLNVGEDVVAYASSDKRLKENILPISNPLQKINSIGGYSFDWNVEKQHIYKGKDYGVIAQEIEEILPELVDTRENGYKAVKYDKLVSLLIEGIKELSSEVQELKQQIKK